MLIEFFGENYGSFRDEFRLSMLATDLDPDSDRGVFNVKIEGDPEPLKLLRCAAIYGPNASGKSTVLRAAAALRRLLSGGWRFRSDELERTYEPLAALHQPFAGETSKHKPCRLGLKAVVNGLVYDYEAHFTARAIVHEQLDQHTADRKLTLFERNAQEVSGEWSKDEQFNLVTRHEKNFRSNVLLLSLADTLVPHLAGNLARALMFHLQWTDGSNIRPIRPGQRTAQWIKREPAFRDWLMGQLGAADIGVTDIVVQKVRRAESEQGRFFEEIEDSVESDSPSSHYRLVFKHRGPDNAFTIPHALESLGTQKLIELAPTFYLLSTTADRAQFIDEIGASLHPSLLKAIIEHFNCRPLSNGKTGQLIFATHETSLLDGEARDAALRRDQVYFTQKGNDGASTLFALSEFDEPVRKVHNIRKRYLEGRYGAIPAIGHFPE